MDSAQETAAVTFEWDHQTLGTVSHALDVMKHDMAGHIRKTEKAGMNVGSDYKASFEMLSRACADVARALNASARPPGKEVQG